MKSGSQIIIFFWAALICISSMYQIPDALAKGPMEKSMNPPAGSTQPPTGVLQSSEITQNKDKHGNTILTVEVKTNRLQALLKDFLPDGLSEEEYRFAFYYFLAYSHTLRDPDSAVSMMKNGILPGFDNETLSRLTSPERTGYLMGVQAALDADPVFLTLEAMGALKPIIPSGSTSTPSNSLPGPALP